MDCLGEDKRDRHIIEPYAKFPGKFPKFPREPQEMEVLKFFEFFTGLVYSFIFCSFFYLDQSTSCPRQWRAVQFLVFISWHGCDPRSHAQRVSLSRYQGKKLRRNFGRMSIPLQ